MPPVPSTPSAKQIMGTPASKSTTKNDSNERTPTVRPTNREILKNNLSKNKLALKQPEPPKLSESTTKPKLTES